MNTSLINVSFRSEEHANQGSLESENESEASNYIDYLDNFNSNFNNLINKNIEKSEIIIKNEAGFVEDEILNFDEDSNHENLIPLNETNTLQSENISFIQETKRDASMLNKNISLINLNVIPEEQDVSFIFNKNFLSFLNDDKNLEPDNSFDSSDSEELGKVERLSRFLTHNKIDHARQFDAKGTKNNKKLIELTFKQSGWEDQKYIISNLGLEGSGKNTNCEDITIGRLRKIGEISPNDVVLESGITISRMHLRFITKYFFGKKTKSDKAFDIFTFILKKRGKTVSKFLLSKIIPFFRKTDQILVQDFGSTVGSFCRIPQNTDLELKANLEFKLSDSISFTVLPIELFINSINLLKKQQVINFVNTSFYGFKNVEEEILKSNLEKRQFLALRTKNCPSSVSEFLIFNPIFENQYTIGRISECDVWVNLTSISRKQAVLIFDGEKWILRDGYNGNPSTNGCWVNFNEQPNKNRLSKKYRVQENEEIMIANVVMKYSIKEQSERE